MRDVMIYTENDQFRPGDEVSGHVVVSTDKSFNCNRIILKIRGREYTHYQAGKVHVSETHQIMDEDLTIWEGGNILSGDTAFEFGFRLPENIPPTLDGLFGEIQYSIEAVVEVDRALDPKSKKDLNVNTCPPPYIPEQLNQLSMKQEKEYLLAEIPTDIVRPNKGLEVRFLVKERSRIKGVRFDIVMHDDVVCQGRNLEGNRGVSEKHVSITYNDYDRWIEETIHEDWSSMKPFEGTLIKSSLLLKVVLEIGLSFDQSIEFPLRLSGEGEKEDDIFDSIELDLGW